MATTIKMPQLGESVTEGTIERWLVKEGDTVEQYDPLFEVVTDKVNAEVPAEVAGTISKILIGDGETVAVGTAVAEIETDGAGAATEAPAAEPAAQPAQAEAPAQPEAAQAEQPAQAEAATSAGAEAVAQQEEAPAPAPAAQPEAAQPSGEPVSGEGTARMTPAVRRLVREHGIDVSQLSGSGAGGRVTREDVLAFIEKGAGAAPQAAPAAPSAPPSPPTAPSSPAPAAAAAPAAPPPQAPAPKPMAVPAPTGGDVEVPLSQMRKGIARKMTQVKQTVPHAYTVVEVDMSNVVKWREANNMAFKAREGASLSYVAVVIKAVTETLRKHPTLNSQFAEDKIILKQAMNIGIAVAVDNGLIVPVIANADQLSISGVNAKIRDLSSRAHANKLRLDELQGGTFTVNNTGWFGSVTSMPIVNAPEVAILSMEAIVKRARVVELDGEDIIAIRPMMNMVCSFDHRVLDGAQVGFFLADVRKALEEWDISTSVG
ncbi:MAG TPA: dihydrolipoamide acetyltransferase family protein [Candidatus Limnocylindria bacterium]|jgi:2-oxoisovalerate dehydrogenase E2 component (dihydrolipoyl transacylase)|nr:dihydrolipoamide acetyltransferase family protein [Candidatus Limnocylindria bacterium]